MIFALPTPASLFSELPFGLQEIEQVRLLLNGDSALDWTRLSLQSEGEVERLIQLLGLESGDPIDERHLRTIYEQALSYLDGYIHYFVSPELRRLEDPRRLFLLASRPGPLAQEACMLLKVMHICHHVAGRELLYLLPAPISELFFRVEHRVFQAIDGLREAGIPIVQFEGSRKAHGSILTKLLCRSDSLAAEVHDRIRFRLVTEDLNDLFEALLYLTRTLFPFNYVVPGESRNDLLDLDATLQSDPELARLAASLQPRPSTAQPVNPYSAKGFKMINFVVDLPIRVADLIPESLPDRDRLGQSVFLLVEFQLADRLTHENNNKGDNRHALYKDRQIRKSLERLLPGCTTSGE